MPAYLTVESSKTLSRGSPSVLLSFLSKAPVTVKSVQHSWVSNRWGSELGPAGCAFCLFQRVSNLWSDLKLIMTRVSYCKFIHNTWVLEFYKHVLLRLLTIVCLPIFWYCAHFRPKCDFPLWQLIKLNTFWKQETHVKAQSNFWSILDFHDSCQIIVCPLRCLSDLWLQLHSFF